MYGEANTRIEGEELEPVWESMEAVAEDQELASQPRPRVSGKFLFVGEQKLWIKGVTYGTFAPDDEGCQFPTERQVQEDFAQMAACGINSVRTYTVPPGWLLDIAGRFGLRVMAGIPWEQHITFLDDKSRVRSIENSVRAMVGSCAGHPALLCFAVGNEIPASIVRWHGRRRIERFIKRLYTIVKAEDSGALVTYVNFPTTEYLRLPFLDFLCFNVYLESQERLEAYLMRLQNLSDERPLLLAEIGLDSRHHGIQKQADSLEWQIRSVFRCGCIGAFIFSWTDEWYRGGSSIEDWDFGLTTRDRQPKPALSTVTHVFADSPFAANTVWPAVSIVICSYNGAATIRDTLNALDKLSYPDYEVIVVNDGSSDDTPKIASEYNVRLISTENHGLSSARNTGYQAARGEIVAYIDDDAYPDSDWARFLALTYLETDYVGVGGPNLAPPGDGPIADCVANAPGGPVHVLLTDTVAEHIPGCNMSFRKSALETVQGCDPRYRTAGDDVDLCWRIQDQVGKIGFHPAAMVWHHRRNSLRMYWRQQQGYGKAEALLEEKWREKYNALGHTSWAGQLYGKGLTLGLDSIQSRIYQGVWGSAPFQTMYQSMPTTLSALPLMPEWYLLVLLFVGISLFGFAWPPLLVFVPVCLVAISLPVLQAIISAYQSQFTSEIRSSWQRYKYVTVTAFMHLMQPLARLIGRVRHGLTPWRATVTKQCRRPERLQHSQWHEQWVSPNDILEKTQASIRNSGIIVTAGGDYDSWDLEIHGGLLGRARLVMATEEHGSGRQMVRFRLFPKWGGCAVVLVILFAGISAGSAVDKAWLVSGLSAILSLLILARKVFESRMAIGAVSSVLRKQGI